MPYTKAQAIEQVYLMVHGGQPSPDVNVRREDIEPYLAAAINYVFTSEIRARKREERADGWAGNATGIDPEFLATYYLDVSYDSERDLRYSQLPVKIVSLPGGVALNMVAPIQGATPYTKSRDQYEIATITAITPNTTYYWYERIGDSERIYYKNISPVVNKVMTRIVVSMEDIGMDERLPIPSDMEIPMLNLVRDWFTGQRQMPADMLNNNKDDKQ